MPTHLSSLVEKGSISPPPAPLDQAAIRELSHACIRLRLTCTIYEQNAQFLQLYWIAHAVPVASIGKVGNLFAGVIRKQMSGSNRSQGALPPCSWSRLRSAAGLHAASDQMLAIVCLVVTAILKVISCASEDMLTLTKPQIQTIGTCR